MPEHHSGQALTTDMVVRVEHDFLPRPIPRPFGFDFSYQWVNDRIVMSEPPNPEVAVFAAALELPADQRGAYLDRACADDVDLRRQVEALLKVHDDAGHFFDKLASAARPDPVGSGILAENIGDRIGRYKLLQQIGEGGCGVVYMAGQEEPVHRRVALKVIKLGMDTKSVVARFEAERQVLALMDHPNIAKVLDAGATDMGRPYFVMELVRGVKITAYCDENQLTTISAPGTFHSSLSRRPARPSERHHSSGPQALQHSGCESRWRAGAKNHRLRHCQGHHGSAAHG